MKSFLITISLLLSVAHAGDRSSAYNLICKPMTFENDRNNCLARIKNYSYFDNKALNICAALVFDADKLSCLDLMADKTYEAYEIDKCEHETFESKKLECLHDNGTVYNPNKPGCVLKEEAIAQISSSIRDLRSGNIKGADLRLSNLLERFNACNN